MTFARWDDRWPTTSWQRLTAGAVAAVVGLAACGAESVIPGRTPLVFVSDGSIAALQNLVVDERAGIVEISVGGAGARASSVLLYQLSDGAPVGRVPVANCTQDAFVTAEPADDAFAVECLASTDNSGGAERATLSTYDLPTRSLLATKSFANVRDIGYAAGMVLLPFRSPQGTTGEALRVADARTLRPLVADVPGDLQEVSGDRVLLKDATTVRVLDAARLRRSHDAVASATERFTIGDATSAKARLVPWSNDVIVLSDRPARARTLFRYEPATSRPSQLALAAAGAALTFDVPRRAIFVAEVADEKVRYQRIDGKDHVANVTDAFPNANGAISLLAVGTETVVQTATGAGVLSADGFHLERPLAIPAEFAIEALSAIANSPEVLVTARQGFAIVPIAATTPTALRIAVPATP